MKYISIITFILIVNCNLAFGWGQKGHDIVTSMAEKHLTPKALKAVAQALDDHTMVYYAAWLDNVRDDPQYLEAKTWHYANIDEGQSYETMTKNSNGDVLTATQLVLEKLKDKKLSDQDRHKYTKYLIHIVADMHCPMHTGRLTDLGGNKYDVKWFNKPTNLHKIWDDLLIESVRKWSYTEWTTNIDIINPVKVSEISAGTPLEWLNQTVIIGKDIYLNTPEGSSQSYAYMLQYYNTLELQLQRAALRLAGLLNEIYG